MPDLLIQPPRLVEVPTSGDTVTTRAATSGASRSRSTQKRPNACWVDARPRCSRPSETGTAGGSRSSTGSRRSRAAASAHSRASAEPSSNAAHGSSAAVSSALASSANCSSESSAEWFAGWPSVGSRQPLSV